MPTVRLADRFGRHYLRMVRQVERSVTHRFINGADVAGSRIHLKIWQIDIPRQFFERSEIPEVAPVIS